MPYVDDNPFPKVLLVEGGAPTTPASGKQALFIDSTDHTPKLKNAAGIISALGGGGSLVELAHSILGSAATSIDLTSLPQTSTHLLIVVLAQLTGAHSIGLRFNGDSGANYSGAETYALSSSAGGDITSSANFAPAGTANTGWTSLFAFVPAYSLTTASAKPLTAMNSSGASFSAAVWNSGAAITEVTLVNGAGDTFQTGSGLWIYGIS